MRIKIQYPNGQSEEFDNPAAVADTLGNVRQGRYLLQDQIEFLKGKEAALTAWLKETLPDQGMTGVSGLNWAVALVPKSVPQVSNWEDFYDFIQRNNRFDFLQRRVADAAVKEWWESGRVVPGVDKFDTKQISLRKVA